MHRTYQNKRGSENYNTEPLSSLRDGFASQGNAFIYYFLFPPLQLIMQDDAHDHAYNANNQTAKQCRPETIDS